ncbi:MAG: DUF3394 domain-containing protein, partial [Rhodobacteraceae bacterium]|nr:DUF3394 domain-containing protein [Paracoccaceae bacterium]
FNTELLLINVTPMKAVFVFVVAVVAMMVFAAATQGYFFARSKLWESLALVIVALTLFRPGFWLDQVQPRYVDMAGVEALRLAEEAPEDATLRMIVRGPDFDHPGEFAEMTVIADLGPKADGASRLATSGLLVMDDGGRAVLEEPMAGTKFFTPFSMYDFYGDDPVEIVTVQTEAERMPKEVFYIPALLLLGLVIAVQRRRQTVPAF